MKSVFLKRSGQNSFPASPIEWALGHRSSDPGWRIPAQAHRADCPGPECCLVGCPQAITPAPACPTSPSSLPARRSRPRGSPTRGLASEVHRVSPRAWSSPGGLRPQADLVQASLKPRGPHSSPRSPGTPRPLGLGRGSPHYNQHTCCPRLHTVSVTPHPPQPSSRSGFLCALSFTGA